MLRPSRSSLIKLVCLIWLAWAGSSCAFTLGAPEVESSAGEPLRVKIPVQISSDEQAILSSLTVEMPSKAIYDQLGISNRIVELNPQAMIYRNRQENLMVLIETVNPVPITDDPFISVLVNLSWENGSQLKTYSFLLADPQKIVVKSGQTLSEIAVNILPELNGVSLDQAMMALFKANPDAFASGNINVMSAGAELTKPSQSVLGSISPAEATRLVLEANQKWRSDRETQANVEVKSDKESAQANKEPSKDTLKISSDIDDDPKKQNLERLVAEEKELEQTKSRIATLEKNISELQGMLDQSKAEEKPVQQKKFSLPSLPDLPILSYLAKLPDLPNVPKQAMLVLVALAILAVTALAFLLLWGLIRFVRKPRFSSVGQDVEVDANPSTSIREQSGFEYGIPERAQAIFSDLNLDLVSSSKKMDSKDQSNAEGSKVVADALRVKINLARAYITIEDFSAAKKSLEEVLSASNTVDPAISIEAQSLLSELAHRQS